MSLLAIRLEKSLVSYLTDSLPGVTLLEGHRNEEQGPLPRVIVTVMSGGGDLVQGAGVDQLEVEIQLLIGSGEAGEREAAGDPLEHLARLADTVRGALQESAQETIEGHLAGEDAGVAFSGIEYTGHKEGMNQERKLHGVVLSYRAYCGLMD